MTTLKEKASPNWDREMKNKPLELFVAGVLFKKGSLSFSWVLGNGARFLNLGCAVRSKLTKKKIMTQSYPGESCL